MNIRIVKGKHGGREKQTRLLDKFFYSTVMKYCHFSWYLHICLDIKQGWQSGFRASELCPVWLKKTRTKQMATSWTRVEWGRSGGHSVCPVVGGHPSLSSAPHVVICIINGTSPNTRCSRSFQNNEEAHDISVFLTASHFSRYSRHFSSQTLITIIIIYISTSCKSFQTIQLSFQMRTNQTFATRCSPQMTCLEFPNIWCQNFRLLPLVDRKHGEFVCSSWKLWI